MPVVNVGQVSNPLPTTAPAAPAAPGGPTRAAWPWRDRPLLGWLLVLLAITLAHPFIPASRWLMVHVLMVGMLSHAILVWSQHFADALLKNPSASNRKWQTRRLMLLHAGVVALVISIPARWWWLSLAGALAVGTAVTWHGCALAVQLRRALPTRFRYTVHYYLAACCCLPIGATLGTILAYGLAETSLADAAHARLLVAHTSVNVLGWVGLTVLGTLTTLWPTMLRTKLARGTERVARLALPALIGGVGAIAVAAWANLAWLASAGLLAYLGGCVALMVVFVRPAVRKRPAHFSTFSTGAGMLWLIGGLVLALVRSVRVHSWALLNEQFGALTTMFVVGFAGQVLLGALSFLLPTVLGGGPSVVRAGLARIGRWGLGRVVVVNLGLAICLAPVPSLVRVLCSLLVFTALAAFLPLSLHTIIAGIRQKRREGPQNLGLPSVGAAKRPDELGDDSRPSRPPKLPRQVVVAVAALALAVAAGVAADPTAAGLGTARPTSNAAPTGRTTTVTVTMRDMRFDPSSITVPLGDRLVIDLVNADAGQVHDLVLQGGMSSGRLGPGQRASVDAGVITADLDGWCSVAGHRQMGMTLRIRTDPAADQAGPAHQLGDEHPGMHHTPGALPDSGPSGGAAQWDAQAAPPADFQARDATLTALPPGTRTHRLTLPVTEQVMPVAPGVHQQRWRFGGTAPGPTLHGRVGDRFEITLINAGDQGHSVDFHAGALAPDQPMRTIAPGQRLTYTFTATRAGAWMYHCSTMPMALHIANGMFGAVIIEPPGLEPVSRTFALVQSEVYSGTRETGSDYTQVIGEHPQAVVFNGYANQYVYRPLPVAVGQRVRVWVLNAGPNRSAAFHVVGGQFDTVYKEGAYLLRRGGSGSSSSGATGGSQVLDLAPAQGGFVEFTLPEAGHYPFVSHSMVDAERGAKGILHAQ